MRISGPTPRALVAVVGRAATCGIIDNCTHSHGGDRGRLSIPQDIDAKGRYRRPTAPDNGPACCHSKPYSDDAPHPQPPCIRRSGEGCRSRAGLTNLSWSFVELGRLLSLENLAPHALRVELVGLANLVDRRGRVDGDLVEPQIHAGQRPVLLQPVPQYPSCVLAEDVAAQVERLQRGATVHDEAQLLCGLVVESVARQVEVSECGIFRHAFQQHLATLVTQPVKTQVERLERRVQLERAPKVLAAIGVHVVVGEVERDDDAPIVKQFGDRLDTPVGDLVVREVERGDGAVVLQPCREDAHRVVVQQIARQ
mmetsp:Transcript_31847/g.63598  ORF Transcript_31847/g.63598 Transcript_31847/m.63598 type:complete len:311 (-) Transcript_31847:683-1615(-)